MEENKEQKTKFGTKLFSWITGYGKDGKGVMKREIIKGYNFKNLFRLYFRRFSPIFTLNIIYILGNFPIVFLVLAMSGLTSHVSDTPVDTLFPILHGIQTINPTTPSLLPLIGVFGNTSTIYASTTFTYILYGLSALDLFLIGPVNMGIYYLMRELVRGEPLFIKDDFIGAVKNNWKQGIIFGIFDTVMLVLIGYSVYSYYINYTNYYILFYASIVMALFYLMMRNYIYLLAVTFDESIFKILKESFIFTLLRFGKNFLALLGCIFLSVLAFSLSRLFMPLGIIMFMVFLISTNIYLCVYAAYPKIKEIKLDPYYKEHPEEKPYGWDGIMEEGRRAEVPDTEEIIPPGDN